MTLPPTASEMAVARWRDGVGTSASRILPEETPVALVHDGSTTAVMMATPSDLEDFAVGFSLTEGLIASPAEITALEVASSSDGVEVRIWLATARSELLAARRRHMAGPVGCGLCGIESLQEATRLPHRVLTGQTVTAEQIHAAMDALDGSQRLGPMTRAVHAAAWWTAADGIRALREDVGRHNALDKLAGALAREESRGEGGILVLTSRVSVEMVQKAAMMGAQVLAAVSAPTLLAVRMAEACGMTLAAVVRDDGFEVFAAPERILG